MKKPKVTMRSLKKEIEALKDHHEAFKQRVREYVLPINSASRTRALMTLTPSNEKGMINGLTIPELVMLVNLSEGTGERIVLTTVFDKKNLQISAVKNPPPTPWELL